MENKSISYFAHEADMARMERTNVRLWVLNIILLLALIISNVCWVRYENQFEDCVETTTVTQEVDAQSDGDSDLMLNTIGGDYYGDESKGQTEDK